MGMFGDPKCVLGCGGPLLHQTHNTVVTPKNVLLWESYVDDEDLWLVSFFFCNRYYHNILGVLS